MKTLFHFLLKRKHIILFSMFVAFCAFVSHAFAQDKSLPDLKLSPQAQLYENGRKHVEEGQKKIDKARQAEKEEEKETITIGGRTVLINKAKGERIKNRSLPTAPEKTDAVRQTLAVSGPNGQRLANVASIYDNGAQEEYEAKLVGASDEEIDGIREKTAGFAAQEYALMSHYSYDPCDENPDCLPYCYYAESQNCPFCNLFKTFFNASSTVTYKSITTFSGSVFKVVIIAFAIWLAVQALAFVSSPETRDIKDFIQSVLTQGFIVAIVCILLNNNVMSFMNQFLEPVFNTGMNIASETLRPEDALKKVVEQEQNHTKKQNAISCKTENNLLSSQEGGALPVSMGNSILCTMTLIDDRASKVKALGSAAICLSWKEAFGGFIPHFNYLFTGIGLWIGSVLLIVGVPFLMLDCVIELAIAGALLPAAVGAYAFKMTRKYTKQVWETFLNAMFAFLFMSLIVLMLTEAFAQVLITEINNNSTDIKTTLDDLIFLKDDGDLKEILYQLPWFSVAFLKVVFVLVLTWTMVKEAREFAGEFSGSIANTSIGSDIGTMGVSTAKGVATKVGAPIAQATGKELWKGTKRVAAAPVHAGRRAWLNYQAKKTQARAQNAQTAGAVTKNQDGSTTYSYTEQKRSWLAPWRKQQVTQSATVGADGRISYRKEMLSKNGTLRVKEKNEHFSVRSQYKKDQTNGTMQQVGKEKIRYNSSKSRRLFNRKNKLDMDMFNEVMSGSNDNMKVAALKTLASGRLPGMSSLKKTKTSSHSLLRDPQSGEIIGYREVMRDGTIHEMKYTTGNGRMKMDFTVLDANGKGKTLTTDGVINRKRTFNGSTQRDANGNVTGINVDQSSVKDAYALSSYYEKYQRQRRFNQIDYNESLFDPNEIKDAKTYMKEQKHWWRDANMTEFTSH